MLLAACSFTRLYYTLNNFNLSAECRRNAVAARWAKYRAKKAKDAEEKS